MTQVEITHEDQLVIGKTYRVVSVGEWGESIFAKSLPVHNNSFEAEIVGHDGDGDITLYIKGWGLQYIPPEAERWINMDVRVFEVEGE